MRDLFESPPLDDPITAAQRGARRTLRQRFYRTVSVGEIGGAFQVSLDGKPVRTPARRPLAAPMRSLAEAVAAEWEAQRDTIDPTSMPLTRLANAIIDGVAAAPAPVAAEIEKYLASDLLIYRAAQPARLQTRQVEHWDPILAWARETLGANFVLAEGVIHVSQPDTALRAAAAAIPGDPWRLGAMHVATTLTGSALIALALSQGEISEEAAWQAAHVDEDWNMEQWGKDAMALERRAFRRAEFQAAALILKT